MQLKNILSIASFVSVLVFASCGNDKTKTGDDGKNAPIVNTPEELKKINDEIQNDPRNPDLYHKRAQYYYAAKNFDAGLADMNTAMKLDSSKAPYYLTLSDLYFVTNKTRQSKEALEKSLQLDDKNVDAMLKLAELYLYVRKYDNSIEYINMALKINQYNSKAYFMKGMNYKELKDTAKAISSMQTAVEQDQQYYYAYMQLGILCAGKRNSLAEQYYRNAIKIQPKSVDAWYDLGKYYQDMEEFDNALEAYKTLLTFDNNKNANYNMGTIYLFNTKSPKLAIERFSNAIKIDQKYVEAYYARGLSYQATGDKMSAINDFQSAITINSMYEPASDALKKLNASK